MEPLRRDLNLRLSPNLVKVIEGPLSLTLTSNCRDLSPLLALPLELVELLRTGHGQMRGTGESKRELFSQLCSFDATHLV